MNRVESAVGERAVRGPEPRAPGLDIPRPSAGAGVGAPFPDLFFELGVCPECGGRLIESSGLLVCEGCWLVAAPVYEAPRLVFDGSAPAAANPARGFYERALEAVAAELGLPAKAALELYKRLKAFAKPEEAVAIALFVTAKRTGAYASLARVSELLSRALESSKLGFKPLRACEASSTALRGSLSTMRRASPSASMEESCFAARAPARGKRPFLILVELPPIHDVDALLRGFGGLR